MHIRGFGACDATHFVTFLNFLRDNLRWLAGGICLTLFSGMGQTYFIALFAGDIRAQFSLSHGEFGGVYMLATLASAISLTWVGRLLDRWRVVSVATLVIICLSLACVLMAWTPSLPMLVLAIYLLRLFGQGMMTHTAMTAMGRWYVAQRGRAVSVAAAGHQLGEGTLPLLIVLLIAALGWRQSWLVAAAVLLLVALPVARITFARDRQPQSDETRAVQAVRQWTLREVLRDIPFWVMCTGVLAPAFIGTSVFFHQVHIAEIKQWAPTVFPAAFVVMSVCTLVSGLVAGQLIDRFTARRVLPVFLLPQAVACAILASSSAPGSAWVFMALLGLSYGFSSTLFGSIWPEIYGSRHLGAIRSMIHAFMVFASALGPGLTGALIDAGIGFERQLVWMSVYCLLIVGVLYSVSRHLHRRLQDPRSCPAELGRARRSR